MKELIRRIDFLSVREEHGANLIEGLCGRRPEVVLDPTLLRKKEEWERFAVQPEISKPYILCYFLGGRKPLREFALRLKKQTGCKLVVVPALNQDLFFGDVRAIRNRSPRVYGADPKCLVYLYRFVSCDDFVHQSGKGFFCIEASRRNRS